MKLSSVLLAVTLCASGTAAFANDTTAQLGIGGLQFVNNPNIEMASEDLSISPEQVKVVYKFHNTADTDQHILVAFPMPDIQGSADFIVGIPTQDPENIFGFATTFDGKPVAATLHQYAFVNNIDYSAELTKLGVPLAPFGDATFKALAALSKDDQKKLADLGLVLTQDIDQGQGLETEINPVWTLRSAYSWEATFAAGADADVVHTYKPSVGGTVQATFVPTNKDGTFNDDDYAKDQYPLYKTKYCVDDELMATLKKTVITNESYSYVPYNESWISYIWSTGGNWFGNIGSFTLTIDKGEANNLVSFCGENVTKIGPTTFQMKATDWVPPYDKELEILILTPHDPT